MLPAYQRELLDQLDFELPDAYLSYLFAVGSAYQFNGAYLVEADELVPFNADYESAEFYPGYFLIGGHDGAAFAVEKASGCFVETPFIGHDEATPVTLGFTWHEFLQHLQAEYS